MKLFIVTNLMLLSLSTQAKICELSINSTDQMKFDQTELSVDADCTTVKLTLNHTGQLAKNVMGHNWVLSKTSDFQSVAQAGMTAGLDNHYVPVNDDRVLAYTEVIGGGESTTITFSTEGLNAGEEYTFFCSFPGHWAIMKGQFNIS
ncbi:azurin [Marinicella sediminis]|uniref:Azurin n=1 Tax=Marinicella sediminis TaxID=1792834 RepID=A0ABV7JHH2_9GAMM|nr:azurin [Marinicella sediminis]